LVDEEAKFMSNPKKSIAERLNAANVVIMNSLNDAEIGALVAEFGYPPGAARGPGVV